MKVIAFEIYHDYDCSEIDNEGFLVPDDFDMQEAHRQWAEETLVPATGKNQYGVWQSKKRKQRTISFKDWLRTKYDPVKIEQCDWW